MESERCDMPEGVKGTGNRDPRSTESCGIRAESEAEFQQEDKEGGGGVGCGSACVARSTVRLPGDGDMSVQDGVRGGGGG